MCPAGPDGIQGDMSDLPREDLCIYTIRLRGEDGAERIMTRPCPYLSACKELGRTCAGFQEGLSLAADAGGKP